MLYLLLNTDYTFAKIAEIAEVTLYFVHDVNRGKVKYDYGGIDIPVRKYKYEKSNMSKELALMIVRYLKQDLSAERIAGIVKVPAYTVG